MIWPCNSNWKLSTCQSVSASWRSKPAASFSTEASSIRALIVSGARAWLDTNAAAEPVSSRNLPSGGSPERALFRSDEAGQGTIALTQAQTLRALNERYSFTDEERAKYLNDNRYFDPFYQPPPWWETNPPKADPFVWNAHRKTYERQSERDARETARAIAREERRQRRDEEWQRRHAERFANVEPDPPILKRRFAVKVLTGGYVGKVGKGFAASLRTARKFRSLDDIEDMKRKWPFHIDLLEGHRIVPIVAEYMSEEWRIDNEED